jgi:hypothetical protein
VAQKERKRLQIIKLFLGNFLMKRDTLESFMHFRPLAGNSTPQMVTRLFFFCVTLEESHPIKFAFDSGAESDLGAMGNSSRNDG